MKTQQGNPWPARIALAVIVGGLGGFAWLMFARDVSPPQVTTEITGGDGWPRTLIEHFPDGRPPRTVVLPRPPQRIVSVTLATDEILLDLVDPKRIAAMSELAPMPDSLISDQLGAIRTFVSSDVESIVALDPDLCFLASYNRDETRSLLIDSGIPVYVFRCFRSLQDVRDNLRIVGQAVGAEAKADALVAEMDRKLAAVAKRLPPRGERHTVLVYDAAGWAPGRGTLQSDVLEAAGLRNVAAEAGVDGFGKLSEERVLELNPDFLLVPTRPGGSEQRAWLLNNPALAPMLAIREQRFLTIGDRLFSSASHHVADAVVQLAHQAYPDRFSDEQH